MKNIALLILLICHIQQGYADSETRLVFSGIAGSVNSEISMQVLERAYGQLGIQVEYRPLPGERSLQTSNAGEVDGEVFRIANVEKKYKNLIRIPTSINKLEAVAFSKNRDLRLANWQSLDGRKFGIQVGIKFAERATKGMKRILVDTNEQLFKMLAANRIDIVVVALTNGLKTLSALNLDSIYRATPSLQVYPLYHYVHKKNADLVAKLDAVLRKMQHSGEIDRIREAYLNGMKNH